MDIGIQPKCKKPGKEGPEVRELENREPVKGEHEKNLERKKLKTEKEFEK